MRRGLLFSATGLLALTLVPAFALVASGQGSCQTDTAGTPVTGVAAQAIPSDLTAIYADAAAHAQLGPDGWAYLAAINRVETDFGRNMATSSAGAIGWMQFEPSTWAQYGQAVGHSGPADPYDPWDAIFAAASYLSASGAPGDWQAAIYSYNHAGSYVNEVTSLAATYAGGGANFVSDSDSTGGCQLTSSSGQPVYLVPGAQAEILPDGQAAAPASAPAAVKEAITAANEIIDRPYLWGGGHDQPLTSPAPSYDCSSAVSFLLHGGGLLSDRPETSTQLESYSDPGPGQWITVYANGPHTFIAIAGIEFSTSATGEPSGWVPAGSGPRWHPDPTGNLADGLTYDVRHPPGL